MTNVINSIDLPVQVNPVLLTSLGGRTKALAFVNRLRRNLPGDNVPTAATVRVRMRLESEQELQYAYVSCNVLWHAIIARHAYDGGGWDHGGLGYRARRRDCYLRG